MSILMSDIRGPGHPDKRMYKWIGNDAGYDHREGHHNDLLGLVTVVGTYSASTNW